MTVELRRVRFLLTLKGRPPFRLAGIEMFKLLTEISDLLKTFIDHIPDERLIRLRAGLSKVDSQHFWDVMDALPDEAIERIINEKISGKIEDIIYEVIEKAVAKEIDRLKRALMGSNTIDDYED